MTKFSEELSKTSSWKDCVSICCYDGVYYFSAYQDSMTNDRWNAGGEEGPVGHYSLVKKPEIVCVVWVVK